MTQGKPLFSKCLIGFPKQKKNLQTQKIKRAMPGFKKEHGFMTGGHTETNTCRENGLRHEDFSFALVTTDRQQTW